MRLAQQLYEGVDLNGERVGLITYMRTDSTTLSARALEQAREVIAAAYGADYLPAAPIQYRTKAKRAQEAHEAIRPTDLARRPQDVARYLDADSARLYELVWKRTVASQMLPAQFERTAVEVTVEVAGAAGGRDALVFSGSGRRIVFPGFLRAYVEGSDDPEAELGDQESLLPALQEGQSLEPLAVAAEGHETRPPMRYTEASLVKRLEEEGIGRPSTYATIISTIQDRGYIVKRGNELVPTFTAFCVTKLLEDHFRDLVDVAFTARMEDELDEVAAGERPWVDLVAAFYSGGGEAAGLLQRLARLGPSFPAVEIGADPASGEKLMVKVGRFGPYLSRGKGGAGNTASLPPDLAPDELTVSRALALLEDKAAGPAPLATDGATGRSITLQSGRFGPYLEQASADGGKPKRVSLPQGLKPEEVTPELAERLMALPRTLGAHPETGEEISAGLGRYGPYLRHGSEFRNLASWQEACELDLERALAILRQPKPNGRGRRQGGAAREVLKELGTLAGAEGPVVVLAGRYGPYVTDGKTNATLPKGTDPAALTSERAAELLAERRAAGPAKRRPFRRRPPQ
jgi:DNA topoisomerase-1